MSNHKTEKKKSVFKEQLATYKASAFKALNALNRRNRSRRSKDASPRIKELRASLKSIVTELEVLLKEEQEALMQEASQLEPLVKYNKLVDLTYTDKWERSRTKIIPETSQSLSRYIDNLRVNFDKTEYSYLRQYK